METNIYVDAWPSSSRLELEARRMHVEPASAGLGGLAPALVLGRLPVIFDACACAIAAALVFPHTLFPRLDFSVTVLCGLALCCLAFVAYPLGDWLASKVDRRHGRGVRLTAAQFVLGASTAAIAFLPDPSALGPVTVLALLGCCRVVQGVAAGGICRRRGGVADAGDNATIAGLATLLALGVAGGLFAVLTFALSPADFLSWGWRYPFIIGVPMNMVALFAQLRLLTTELNRQDGDKPGIRLVASRTS